MWRDLAYWQLHQWPTLPHSGLREQLSTRPWAQGAEAAARLEAWRRGRTGFPLVDAGMRELWATGWMQQSVRMVAASFLVDVLNVPWTEGALIARLTFCSRCVRSRQRSWSCDASAPFGDANASSWRWSLSAASGYSDSEGLTTASVSSDSCRGAVVPRLPRGRRPGDQFHDVVRISMQFLPEALLLPACTPCLLRQSPVNACFPLWCLGVINLPPRQNCAGTGMDPWNFVLDPGSSYQDPTGASAGSSPALMRLLKLDSLAPPPAAASV